MTEITNLVEQVTDVDENKLEAYLGLYVQQQGEDWLKDESVDEIDLEMMEVGARAKGVVEFGKRFAEKFNAEAYDLLCGNPFDDDGETLKKLEYSLKEGTNQAAGLIAPLLVAQLGLAPAVAAIIATLVVKKLAKAVGDTICEMWKESLEEGES
ncbi:MAG: hypothetical protein F6K10_11690 [Moorea sp. SIO2B7]|nr:hypothetical protein [Moorena sp. SIO2B7]